MRKLARILVPGLLAVASHRLRRLGLLHPDRRPSGESDSSSAEPSPSDSTAVPERRRRRPGHLDRRPQARRRPGRWPTPSARPTASPSRSRPSPRTSRPTSSPPTPPATAPTSSSAPTTGSATWSQNGAIEPLQLTPDQLSGYSDEGRRRDDVRRPALRRALRHRGARALPQHRRRARRAQDAATTPIAAGQAAVKAGKVDSALNLPVGELGDAYHMEPILTSFGGYIFGYDERRRRLQPRGRRHRQGRLDRRRARRSPQLAKAEGAAHLDHRRQLDRAVHRAARRPSWSPARGRCPTCRRAGIKYAIQPVPGFAGQEPGAAVHGAQAFMVAAGGAERRPSPRSSSPTASTTRRP